MFMDTHEFRQYEAAHNYILDFLYYVKPYRNNPLSKKDKNWSKIRKKMVTASRAHKTLKWKKKGVSIFEHKLLHSDAISKGNAFEEKVINLMIKRIEKSHK